LFDAKKSTKNSPNEEREAFSLQKKQNRENKIGVEIILAKNKKKRDFSRTGFKLLQ